MASFGELIVAPLFFSVCSRFVAFGLFVFKIVLYNHSSGVSVNAILVLKSLEI